MIEGNKTFNWNLANFIYLLYKKNNLSFSNNYQTPCTTDTDPLGAEDPLLKAPIVISQ